MSVEDEQARARALLEATHQFPCDYPLRVIANNEELVTRAVLEAVKRVAARAGARPTDSDSDPMSYGTQASSGGKYLSHRFEVRVTSADDVLALYASVRAVPGVVTII